MRAVYDTIGTGYVAKRQADPRITRGIRAALGDAASVVNVGVGAGSCEPSDLLVAAVEPSREMIDRRAKSRTPVVQAVAERLPFPDGAFYAALAVLTVHHWGDRRAGLAELAQVARRVVIVTWDPACRDSCRLPAESLPEILELDVSRFPPLDELARCLGKIDVRALPAPHDCVDGFLGAFSRRPETYLGPTVRSTMSGFAQVAAGRVDAGLKRLVEDLHTGRWTARFWHLRNQDTADLGYRLVVAERPGPAGPSL